MKKFFLNKNWQLIYSLTLVILIPVVIILNTLSLNRNFKTNIEIQLQRQVLAFGRLFNVVLLDSTWSNEEIQSAIDLTLAKQKDIVAIQVSNYENESFRVLASSVAGQINRQIFSPHYFFSWQRNEAVASMVTKENLLNIFPSTDNIFFANKRYWLVVMPLVDNNNSKQYLLAMVISLDVMDQLITTTFTRSYIFLTVTVLVLILLLSANTRLFEYAVLYRKIKEIDKMKDDFISIASHELRTPLTVIKGYVSMLLVDGQNVLTKQLRDYLNTISGATERLAILVDDLLNVSRIEQGRLKIEFEIIDPLPIVKEVLSEFKVEADKKNIVLSCECTGNYLIKADVARLKQVFVNIIGNALKYTMTGSVKVKFSVKNDRLEIKTIDTGIGMSAPERERLFQKFYRIKNDKTKNIVGTGLGLWITKEIVAMMSGQIYIDSIEGVGTQVSINFPLVKKNIN